MTDRCQTFRSRLIAGDVLAGTFLKTPSAIAAEVLGLSSLDAVAIDAEHAPFGRLELDACIAALRAADMPTLVRLSSDAPTQIRNALDCGASGFIVPHVTSADQARDIARASQFGDGGRGFAGSPRAAGYTTLGMDEYREHAREHTIAVVQIEDVSALDNVSDIAAVDGIDCLFVGRIDLAVGMQADPMSDKVISAVQEICKATRAAGKAIGMFTPAMDEIPSWIDEGASLFLLGSDQSMILTGANQLADSIR